MRDASNWVAKRAVEQAKAGYRVVLVMVHGDITFEQGTGNIQSVRLPALRGLSIDWIAVDEWRNQGDGQA